MVNCNREVGGQRVKSLTSFPLIFWYSCNVVTTIMHHIRFMYDQFVTLSIRYLWVLLGGSEN